MANEPTKEPTFRELRFALLSGNPAQAFDRFRPDPAPSGAGYLVNRDREGKRDINKENYNAFMNAFARHLQGQPSNSAMIDPQHAHPFHFIQAMAYTCGNQQSEFYDINVEHVALAISLAADILEKGALVKNIVAPDEGLAKSPAVIQGESAPELTKEVTKDLALLLHYATVTEGFPEALARLEKAPSGRKDSVQKTSELAAKLAAASGKRDMTLACLASAMRETTFQRNIFAKDAVFGFLRQAIISGARNLLVSSHEGGIGIRSLLDGTMASPVFGDPAKGENSEAHRRLLREATSIEDHTSSVWSFYRNRRAEGATRFKIAREWLFLKSQFGGAGMKLAEATLAHGENDPAQQDAESKKFRRSARYFLSRGRIYAARTVLGVGPDSAAIRAARQQIQRTWDPA